MALSALIVAAGSSRRMGFDKLEADLAGRSVLARSLQAFQACPGVAEIRVVAAPGKLDAVAATAREAGVSKFVEAVAGGSERHLSVHAGLQRIGADAALVAVHDGARPLVTPEAVARCAAEAERCGAASLARRVADTLKRADDSGAVLGPVSRENLWAMETPQIFRRELLLRAYEALLASGGTATDEVSAVEALGHPVMLVENSEPNFKITVPGDLALAAALWRERPGAADSNP